MECFEKGVECADKLPERETASKLTKHAKHLSRVGKPGVPL
jgi:hypothetical protein